MNINHIYEDEAETKFYYDNITHPEGFKKHPEPVLRGVAYFHVNILL